MNDQLILVLHWQDWLQLFAQFTLLSLLSIGGAISTTSDMHRFLVEQQHWMSPAQFTTSIALAQAAPGPNVLFVAVMGWQVGINTGSVWNGLLGVLLTMTGILLPSTLITYGASQWGHRNRRLRAVRAFKHAMAPIVLGLLLATGWILANSNAAGGSAWRLWIATGASVVLLWKTRIPVLWIVGAGALLGALDFI